MTHELKIDDKYFIEILLGLKTFEVRINDRDYKIGDEIKLNQIKEGAPTGLYIRRKIKYVHSGLGMAVNYVVLGLARLENWEAEHIVNPPTCKAERTDGYGSVTGYYLKRRDPGNDSRDGQREATDPYDYHQIYTYPQNILFDIDPETLELVIGKGGSLNERN